MEILRGTVSEVKFYLPTSNTTVTSATYHLNDDTTEVSLATPVVLNGVATAKLPYLQSEGRLTLTWNINIPGSGTFAEKDYFDIVTPILPLKEVLEIVEGATDKEAQAVESAVRHIINAHTGQKFGKFIGTHSVRGGNGLALQLPARLIELNTVNGTDAAGYFTLEGDGYVLRHFPWGVPPIKADYYGLHEHKGGVIHNPNNVRLGEFYQSMTYDINGTWGWYEVPTQVAEAAKLLVNDYACADSQYRDRYLVSMTAADWRIQFSSGAYAKTGNVRADQLLNDYVLKRGWAVL